MLSANSLVKSLKRKLDVTEYSVELDDHKHNKFVVRGIDHSAAVLKMPGDIAKMLYTVFWHD